MVLRDSVVFVVHGSVFTTKEETIIIWAESVGHSSNVFLVTLTKILFHICFCNIVTKNKNIYIFFLFIYYYMRTLSRDWRIGTHQRQEMKQKGTTNKKSDEKEREQRTVGEFPYPNQGNCCAHRGRRAEGKQKRTKRKKQGAGPQPSHLGPIHSPPTTRSEPIHFFLLNIII